MIKQIAFDFDGTLADSVDFCLAVYDIVFKKYMGEKAPAKEEVYQSFGMNEPGVIRHFFGKENPEAVETFNHYHRKLHAEMCPEPYPGIIDLLDYLKGTGVSMTILTGRSEETCKISMECLNMGHYFSGFQYGSAEKNDKCAQLLKLISEPGLKNDEIVYVGDAVSDATSSQAAGVKCLSAAWAKSARLDELEKINPGLVFRTVEDLKKYFRENGNF